MIRFLATNAQMLDSSEELLAVCILEEIPFVSITSEQLQTENAEVLQALHELPLVLQRELALSTLRELIR